MSGNRDAAPRHRHELGHIGPRRQPAPVRARAPRLSRASIRIMELVADGKFAFYAEIAMLRQLVDLTKNGPPLLDDLLHGTNPPIAVIVLRPVRGLVQRGAIGILTTHDLALERTLPRFLPPQPTVHFEDFLAGREDHF